MATPAHQVGGARDRVVQGPVPGVPHPPALQQQRGAGDFLGRDVANGSIRDPHPHMDGGMPRTSRRARTLPYTVCSRLCWRLEKN